MPRPRLPAPRRPVRALDTSFAIVNVVLLLIFFFLATGQLFGSPDPGVALARTLNLPIAWLPRPLLVVGDDGALTLDDVPVAPDLLGPAIRAATDETAPVLHVFIAGEARATDLVTLLANPTLAGVEMRLVTLDVDP